VIIMVVLVHIAQLFNILISRSFLCTAKGDCWNEKLDWNYKFTICMFSFL